MFAADSVVTGARFQVAAESDEHVFGYLKPEMI
jgi:hypothetical protein